MAKKSSKNAVKLEGSSHFFLSFFFFKAVLWVNEALGSVLETSFGDGNAS